MGEVNNPFIFKQNFQLNNRLVMAPMTTSSAEGNGAISQEDLDFFDRTSKDFGAIIVGSQAVSILGTGFERGWKIYDKAVDSSLKTLADVIHGNGSKAILQLYHAGRMAEPFLIRHHQPVSPSEIPTPRSFASFPRQLAHLEIEQIIDDFCMATKKAIDLGFDGVEIHGANTYLVQQFFSQHSNRRTDQWGGTREKRMRFATELIKRMAAVIDKHTNDDFILGYRFSPEEYEIPGIRLRDTKKLLDVLDELPVDYFHLSVSSYKKKSLDGEDILDELLNQNYKAPLIACGGVRNHEDIKEVLAKAPFVSVANAPVIDPNWASKILNNDATINEKILISDLDKLKLPSGLKKLVTSYPTVYLTAD
ncbi:NADH-dependent flavin oxidoreductase [Aerococcaceae bacterium DSM 111021]|nr:NADH-dependent flavin oxidoreductase [Aerococcaceae bacterium DSM 111021]